MRKIHKEVEETELRTIKKTANPKLRRYNESEAVLQAWKRELEQFKADRKDSVAKQKLLAIINSDCALDERSSMFNTEMKQILSTQTEDESWSFWGWLWSLISWCWSSSSTEEKKLSDLLGKTMRTPSFKPLALTGASSAGSLLSDTDYETALFIDPPKALADIESRILFGQINRDNLRTLFTRLDAIKYHLNPDAYQILLSPLYKKFPKETLIYHYPSILEQNNDCAVDFIGNELMSRALMELFILTINIVDPTEKTIDTNQIYQRCFAIEKLLLLLAFREESKFVELLASKDLAKGLSESFNNLKPHILEEWELSFLKPRAHSLNEKPEEQDANPILKSSEDFLLYQPLLGNFARLACLELLLNYHRLTVEQQKTVSFLLQTIEIVSQQVLGTWEEAAKERSDSNKGKYEIFYPAEMEEIVKQKPTLNPCYQTAIIYGNRLILQSISVDAEAEPFMFYYSNRLIIQLAVDIKDQQRAPHEMTWIRSLAEWFKLPKLFAEPKSEKPSADWHQPSNKPTFPNSNSFSNNSPKVPVSSNSNADQSTPHL